MGSVRRAHALAAVLTVAAVLGALTSPAAAGQARAADKPTVVLVHGAFADSSSWNGVVSQLLAQGYPVLAVANPLRGVKSDADQVAAVLKSIDGPIVLVGHSYGGEVISAAADGNPNVKALVYVAAFAPDTGESAADLSAKFPGGTLGQALAPPVAVPGGDDLYIQQDKFREQFAADVPVEQATQMAVTQRPIAQAALAEKAEAAAWKTIPSYFVYGSADKNIPAAVQDFMAKRAGAKETVVVGDASHVIMVSHPDVVAKMIQDAATAS
ncbi:alpha/beta hydrolase [Catellatospora sp. TT07R-123]|uniref:alpha/beta fold hydrolase n=1 Tax=Catellatospora sp. TT07R-123 TaxID=2733863 RepID=UPI001B083F90|nr:alpha/beta hydrolase [Catellatospora sp. TT07R-123]GHJ48279.1 alpha/beta hydrolase [Catellatospora sp. TT07R-123]